MPLAIKVLKHDYIFSSVFPIVSSFFESQLLCFKFPFALAGFFFPQMHQFGCLVVTFLLMLVADFYFPRIKPPNHLFLAKLA